MLSDALFTCMMHFFMLMICVNTLFIFLLTFMMCTEYANVCRVGNFMYAHCTCCTVFELIIFLINPFWRNISPFSCVLYIFFNIFILVYYIDWSLIFAFMAENLPITYGGKSVRLFTWALQLPKERFYFLSYNFLFNYLSTSCYWLFFVYVIAIFLCFLLPK